VAIVLRFCQRSSRGPTLKLPIRQTFSFQNNILPIQFFIFHYQYFGHAFSSARANLNRPID